jgi:hypothetical protein
MGNAIAAQTADTPDGQNGVKHGRGPKRYATHFQDHPRRRDKDCGSGIIDEQTGQQAKLGGGERVGPGQPARHADCKQSRAAKTSYKYCFDRRIVDAE